MAKLTRETTKEITKTSEKQTEVYSTEPDYIKLYLHDLMYLSDLPERYAKVLFALLPQASWAKDGMRVTVTAGSKRLMCKDLGFKSTQTISNALSDMTKANILHRIETGVYALNPMFFGRGDWRDIQALRLKVDYKLTGKTFAAVVGYRKRHEINITPKPEQLTKGQGGGDDGDSDGHRETSGTNN